MGCTGGAIIKHGEQHPRDAEVAYKMQKIQIHTREKWQLRPTASFENQQKPFRDFESACAR
jgi:hypothetical protein